MTDLQLGLALIGGLAVVALLVHNRWQEGRVRREAQRAFASGHPDVLGGEGRREPAIEARRAPTPKGSPADERIDYVMDLSLPEAAAQSELAEGWRPIELRFSGRALLAQDGNDARASLQIVSRTGVVSDAELLEFRSAVETVAASVGAVVRAPEMRAALDAARELDRTCAEVDIQIALHVVGVDPAGVTLEGQPFQAAAREGGVTFTLDVARTRQPARSYEAMARAGRQLAQEQGGRLVDDTGRELDERALAAVGAQMETVAQRLAACGIEPGSPLALRLFS
jgi:hypothetical protein